MGHVRPRALVLLFLIIGGCAPAPLPPLTQASVAVSSASICFGLNTKFRYFADDFGADENTKRLFGTVQQPSFLEMFGFAGSTSMKGRPAYAEASIDAQQSALHLRLYTDDRSLAGQMRIPNTRVLSCTTEQSVLAVESSSCGEGGCENWRRTITLSHHQNLAHINTKVELEASRFFLRASREREYWGSFRSYDAR